MSLWRCRAGGLPARPVLPEARKEHTVADEPEKRWEYDAVEPGGAPSHPKETPITPESISAYASRVRNPNPAYRELRDGMLAMPTQVFAAARLRRGDIAAANGYVALEWVKENSRQTPFAKCKFRWFAPMRAGDTITSSGYVLEKYERRGNRFVTFRVEAINQHGVKVAEYDYTSIFEYGRGQKRR